MRTGPAGPGSAAASHPRRRVAAAPAWIGAAILVVAWLLPAPGGAAEPGSAPTSAADTPEVVAGMRPLGPACDGAPAGRFPDVSGVHLEGIDCIGWWGVSAGDAAGRYLPQQSVRREQMASFIDRTLGLAGVEPAHADAPRFDDLEGGVHDEAIARLAALEVVSGVDAGRFDPTGTVSRAQMASFLARAYEASAGQPLPIGEVHFSDVDGNVHADNIARIARAGLTAGVDADRFDPRGEVTRGQMGTFLARLLALLVDEDLLSFPPADPVPIPEPPEPEPVTLEDLGAVLPGDALPGWGGSAPIPVPAHPPVILASTGVDLRPGEEQRVVAALDTQIADVHYWFDTGPASESFEGDQCPEPGGRGIGMTDSIAAEDGGEQRSGRWEPGGDDCLRAAMWAHGVSLAHQGTSGVVVVDNAGSQRFRSQLHLAQGPWFPQIVHPPGRSATYRYDTTQTARWVRSLPVHHPLRIWRTRVEVTEPSIIGVIEAPVGTNELCAGQYVAYVFEDLETGELRFVSPDLVQSPGRCELRVETDGAARLEIIVPNDGYRNVEVAPRR